MRGYTSVLAFLMAVPAFADELPKPKNKPPHVWLAAGRTEGYFNQKFVYYEQRSARIDTTMRTVTGGAAGARWHITLEKSWAPDNPDVQDFSAEGRHQLFRASDFRLGIRGEYRDFSNSAETFSSGGTRLVSAHSQTHRALGGDMGIGADNHSNFRVVFMYGNIQVESALETRINGTPAPSPADKVLTEKTRFLAYGIKTSVRSRGFTLSGSAMYYILPDSVNERTRFLNEQGIVQGSASYVTPWHFGAQISATKVIGPKSAEFRSPSLLQDTVTLSAIVRFP